MKYFIYVRKSTDVEDKQVLSIEAQLAELHLNYESLKPIWEDRKSSCKLVIDPKAKIKDLYRVEKMKLSKDKTGLQINKNITVIGIPPEVSDYRLGNRSALEWVIDQYQMKTHKRSGIISDPNREDDPEYIVRLVGQVIRVSLETVKIVKGLPKEFS